jgi:hypothetical protein
MPDEAAVASTATDPALAPPPGVSVDAETGDIIVPGGRIPGPGKESASAAAPAKPVAAAVVAAPAPDPLARAHEVAERLRAKGRARRERESREQAEAGRQAQLGAQVEQERAARVAAENRAAAYERDPLGALRARGVTDKALAQAAIDDASPEGRLAKLTAELQRVDAENRAFRDQQTQRDRAAAGTQARDRFVALAVESVETGDDGKPTDLLVYPHVAAYARADREGVLIRAEKLMDQARANGYQPTFAQTLAHLEAIYEKAAKLLPGAAVEPTAEPPKPAVKKSAAGAKTLTAKTQERPTLGKSFDDLEPDEQIAVMQEQVRRLAVTT